MKMLRMMCRVTQRDRLKNEYVKASVNVDSIVNKLAQSILKWFEHLCRKGEKDVVKKVWGWDREVKLSRGRPEQTWDGVVKKDMERRGLKQECAQDQGEWRSAIYIPALVKQGDR